MQIDKGVNTAATSSMGRLFDAAAAVAGMGAENRFEAQLPMALEAAIERSENGAYSVVIEDAGDGPVLLDPRVIIGEMIADASKGVSAGALAARFHNTVAAGLLEFARQAREKTGIGTAALSGGVFCNRYLTDRLIRLLKDDGFCVLFKRQVPVNDGGIALGQAAIAAARFL